MSFTTERISLSLTDLLRTHPMVTPRDSLQRFLEILRYTPYSMLPVVDGAKLVGYMYLEDTFSLLTIDDPEARLQASYLPVSSKMRQVTVVATADLTPLAVGRLFNESGSELMGVTDSDGYYLGFVIARDLFGFERPPLRMPQIGGMATPFGVYLSDGTHQAGAGNLALVASGVALGLLGSITVLCVRVLVTWIGTAAHWNPAYLDPTYSPPADHPALGLLSVGFSLLTTLLFLLLMRATPIAGYHAAEHQSVHTVEQGEPLEPEIVSRMPRPHPRCGTNLLAIGILFFNLSTLLKCTPYFDPEDATVVAALFTLFFWRQFGAFLQTAFTTRPANSRQIASGIAAARSLIELYRNDMPRRPHLIRRIWCSGLLQTALGFGLTSLILSPLLTYMSRILS